MAWRIIIGLEDGAWSAPGEVPVDARSGWTEPGDGAFPGYRAQRYADEAEANSVVRSFRARGFSASTEWLADDAPLV